MNKYKYLIWGCIIGLIFGGIFIWVVSYFQSDTQMSELIDDSEGTFKIQLSAPAPEFLLESVSGNKIKLGDLTGKIVLVNFWATWCVPCREEMPVFQTYFDKYPEKIIILAINAQDSQESMLAYKNELDLTFPMLIDPDNAVHRSYLVRGFPTSFIIDQEGVLKVQHVGAMTEDQLISYLNKIGFESGY
jgi:thiol-disulfide isomerase/thioredoxin